jgi:hypothetical protein
MRPPASTDPLAASRPGTWGGTASSSSRLRGLVPSGASHRTSASAPARVIAATAPSRASGASTATLDRWTPRRWAAAAAACGLRAQAGTALTNASGWSAATQVTPGTASRRSGRRVAGHARPL